MGTSANFATCVGRLPSSLLLGSARLLGGVVGAVRGCGILASGVSQMLLDTRTSEGRKALMHGRESAAKQSAAIVPVREEIAVNEPLMETSNVQAKLGSTADEPGKVTLEAIKNQRQAQSNIPAASRARRQAYEDKKRKMMEEADAARQRHAWIMRNLREMKTSKEQEEFMEFIAIPPTPPPRDLSAWQTDHVFHSAEAIQRVVRCLNPAFDAVAPDITAPPPDDHPAQNDGDAAQGDNAPKN